MTTLTTPVAVDQSLLYPSPYKEFWHAFSRNKGAVAGLMFMLLVIFCAIFAPWVAPHDPSEQYRDFLLTPPSWLEGGQIQFLLGTDELGRDLLSRLINGSRLSLLIGLSSVVMSLIPGILLGLFAGFFPRLLGPTIMRLMDIMLALPSLLLAVAIVAILGPGLINTIIAIAVVSLPSYVRLDPRRGDGRIEPRLRDRRAPGRCRSATPDVRHRAAQLHGAADRSGHLEFLLGDSRCRGTGLPRPWRTTANP
jgi:ABC-type dipeptide/oligopeptide/nickel transport systems, permease components